MRRQRYRKNRPGIGAALSRHSYEETTTKKCNVRAGEKGSPKLAAWPTSPGQPASSPAQATTTGTRTNAPHLSQSLVFSSSAPSPLRVLHLPRSLLRRCSPTTQGAKRHPTRPPPHHFHALFSSASPHSTSPSLQSGVPSSFARCKGVVLQASPRLPPRREASRPTTGSSAAYFQHVRGVACGALGRLGQINTEWCMPCYARKSELFARVPHSPSTNIERVLVHLF